MPARLARQGTAGTLIAVPGNDERDRDRSGPSLAMEMGHESHIHGAQQPLRSFLLCQMNFSTSPGKSATALQQREEAAETPPNGRWKAASC